MARHFIKRRGLLKKCWATHREAWHLTEMLGLSQERTGFSQTGWASCREAEPLTARQGLSKRGLVYYREAGLSQRDRPAF